MIKLNGGYYTRTFAHKGKNLKILYCFKFMPIVLTEGY